MPPLRPPWRSLQELGADARLLAEAAQEFPALGAALAQGVDRRRVLKLMAAAAAMSGLGGCDLGEPEGKIIPAVVAPPGVVPGRPNYYASVHSHAGFGSGIVVTHHMGRPAQVAGNPHHPASLGAVDVFAAAMPLDFYDPERNAGMMHDGQPVEPERLTELLDRHRGRWSHDGGTGLRILTGTVTSPTLNAQLDRLASRYPQSRWHRFEPCGRDAVYAGNAAAFGRPLDSVIDLAAADIVVGFDSDLISTVPGHLRYARDFAARRNPTRTAMSRVYAIEPTPTLLGAAADHRFVAKSRDLPVLLAQLHQRLVGGARVSNAPDWLEVMARDLLAHRGRALVHVGERQSAASHAHAAAINAKLEAPGNTLHWIAPVERGADDASSSFAVLVEDMHAGKVETLIIIDSNPLYAAPAHLEFAAALKRVPVSICLSVLPNETSSASRWFEPLRHPWEDWSDTRAYDGTTSLQQPQAGVLYGAVSAHGFLDSLWNDHPVSSESVVRAAWPTLDEQQWRAALALGVIEHSAARVETVSLRELPATTVPPTLAAPATLAVPPALTVPPTLAVPPGAPVPPPLPVGPAATMPPSDSPNADATSLEERLSVSFRPDPHLWDGRYANNPWLQELPRPFTKLTWDNPLLISPVLARRKQLHNGDRVRLRVGAASVEAPVWILPGQADDTIIALLGFGRAQGDVAAGAGWNYAPLMADTGIESVADIENAAGAAGVGFDKIAGTIALASTEHHALLVEQATDIVRRGTLARFEQDPRYLTPRHAAEEIYRPPPSAPAAWAMSIDLNACIGCNSCMVACQSENNVPTVGKDQVLAQREMHWLRIDRYFEGTSDEPALHFQPMLCMHCEQAPCETVCPVGATVHDEEGLNLMVYNRCVGTRFCSNNCPYKVRRFNYYPFAKHEHRTPESRNPEVTVRARGVMEKCTFCVQRIAAARADADRDNHAVGTVRTACQEACPTRAITFGNLADPDSEVVARKGSPLNYALLAEQNTHPRVTYEALIRNPHPDLEETR